jgi:hypothetical protein
MALSAVNWTRIRALAFGGAVPGVLLGSIFVWGHALNRQSDDNLPPPTLPTPSVSRSFGAPSGAVGGVGGGGVGGGLRGRATTPDERFTLPNVTDFREQAAPSDVRLCQQVTHQPGRAPVSAGPVTGQCPAAAE